MERMIIVAGRIYVAPGTRAQFLEDSRAGTKDARLARGCREFVVAADPLEPDRVNIYEEWDSAADLTLFRGDGPTAALTVSIIRMDVTRHQVTSSVPA